MELTLQKYGSYEKFEQATGGSLLSKTRIWSHVRKYMVKEGCLGEVWAMGDLGTWLWYWHLQSVPHTCFFPAGFVWPVPLTHRTGLLPPFSALFDSYMCNLRCLVCYWENSLQCSLIDRPVSFISLKPWHWQGTGAPHNLTHELVLPSPCVDSGAQTWGAILQGKHLCPWAILSPLPLFKVLRLELRALGKHSTLKVYSLLFLLETEFY